MIRRDHRDHVVFGKRIEVRECHALSAPEAAAVLEGRCGGIDGFGAERAAFTGVRQDRSGVDLPFDPDGTDPAPDAGEGLAAVLEDPPLRLDLVDGEHGPSYSDWGDNPIKPS